VLDVCLVLLSVGPLVSTAYLALLAAVSLRSPKRPVCRRDDGPRFDVVIPAHDEASTIARTVTSVHGVDYPRASYRVVVVADNCSDDTAERARAAGAHVLVRVDPDKRGKGHALAHAFAWSRANGHADAVVVIDADTSVSPNLLSAFAARLACGAEAMQADYGVRNAAASWRTRLMVIALATFHGLRSRARETLGLSSGLRGNGMAFSSTVLQRVPYDAFSIVEDVEFGLRLGAAGVRVAYVEEASVKGDMATTGVGASSQRRRWESGRRDLRPQAWALLWRGIRERSAMLLDLGIDLLILPLARLATWIVLGTAAAWTTLTMAHRHHSDARAWIAWGISSFFLAAYVARGAQLSGVGLRAVLDLAAAPLYVAWKVAVPSKRPETWVRTTRETTK
jgi:cellulose synthase/poly-beta-1,6-N-acetylglucosamine synthase-like glycosyltransferase